MVTDPGPAASSVTPVRSTRAPSLNTVTPVIGASIGCLRPPALRPAVLRSSRS